MTSQTVDHSDSQHLGHEQLLLLPDADNPDQAPHCDAPAPGKSSPVFSLNHVE